MRQPQFLLAGIDFALLEPLPKIIRHPVLKNRSDRLFLPQIIGKKFSPYSGDF